MPKTKTVLKSALQKNIFVTINGIAKMERMKRSVFTKIRVLEIDLNVRMANSALIKLLHAMESKTVKTVVMNH